MLNLTPEEQAIIRKLLLSNEVQFLIGAEKWDLTEEEEDKLWVIIERLKS